MCSNHVGIMEITRFRLVKSAHILIELFLRHSGVFPAICVFTVIRYRRCYRYFEIVQHLDLKTSEEEDLRKPQGVDRSCLCISKLT